MTSIPKISNLIKNYKFAENAFLPKTVIVPLYQDKNIDFVNIVNIGDRVNEGEIIAVGKNHENVKLHSPIPGTITDIIPCICAGGIQKYGVKIELKGSFSYIGKKIDERNIELLSKDEIADILMDKGVINTFYTGKPQNLGMQLNEQKCLIVRMYDEDPYRITDSLMTKFLFKEIILGAQVIAKAINAEGILFAIDQKLANKENLKVDHIKNARILEMNLEKYPLGSPREIISGFERRMKSGCNFNATKKDLFIDSSTAFEVYKAVLLNTPSIDKYIHISGNCIKTSCFLNVKLGTSVYSLINSLGGFIRSPKLVVVNGLIAGKSVNSLDFPITKDIKSLTFISKRNFTDNHVYDCINCGNCRFACPVKISPDVLYNSATQFNEIDENFIGSIKKCTNCGVCNTVCPSRLPIAQTMDGLKSKLNVNILEEKNV